MFGLSWAQIGIIVLVGAFVLGPERIPTAVSFVTKNLQRVRSMAAGAQSDLRREIGPELDELRRQVADLRSLADSQGLRDLQDLHPKRLLSKNLLGDDLPGGITGFLGLKADPPKIIALDGATAAESENDLAPKPQAPPTLIKQPQQPSDGDRPPVEQSLPVAAGRRPPFDSEGT
jgi:sec-independent protein translocase protein TatB